MTKEQGRSVSYPTTCMRDQYFTRIDEPVVFDPQCHVSGVQHIIPKVLHQLELNCREYLACGQSLTDDRELFCFDKGADGIQNIPITVGIRRDAGNRHAGLHAVLRVNLFNKLRETRSGVELCDVEGMSTRGSLESAQVSSQYTDNKVKD